MPEILLVVALPEENADNLLGNLGHEILYTGVGKVNAAFHLASELARRDCSQLCVVNAGSAGSHVFPAGEVYCATRFFERDMDATALGFALGQTPFESDIVLESGLALPGLSQATCYTGDSFVTCRHPTLAFELIDMEAYALAKVCHRLRIPFASLKFVTDGADGQAAGDWNSAVVMAARRLHDALAACLPDLARICK